MIRRARALSVWVILIGSWVFVGCGTDIAAPPPPLPECTGPVTVSVDTGTTPKFSWTGNCLVGRLIVEEGVEERWGTETPGLNIYESPITYDVAPPGSTKYEPAAPLVRGTIYRVTVFRWFSYVPESLEVLGFKNFTP